jgi:hypothetical protein
MFLYNYPDATQAQVHAQFGAADDYFIDLFSDSQSGHNAGASQAQLERKRSKKKAHVAFDDDTLSRETPLDDAVRLADDSQQQEETPIDTIIQDIRQSNKEKFALMERLAQNVELAQATKQDAQLPGEEDD